jgi:hypothetical protein
VPGVVAAQSCQLRGACPRQGGRRLRSHYRREGRRRDCDAVCRGLPGSHPHAFGRPCAVGGGERERSRFRAFSPSSRRRDTGLSRSLPSGTQEMIDSKSLPASTRCFKCLRLEEAARPSQRMVRLLHRISDREAVGTWRSRRLIGADRELFRRHDRPPRGPTSGPEQVVTAYAVRGSVQAEIRGAAPVRRTEGRHQRLRGSVHSVPGAG